MKLEPFKARDISPNTTKVVQWADAAEVERQRDEAVKLLNAIASTYRTFRNVPKHKQEWTTILSLTEPVFAASSFSIDDETLNAIFAFLERMKEKT